MSSEQTRDPVRDHLLTPQNSALIVIDYQPSQLRAVTSMDSGTANAQHRLRGSSCQARQALQASGCAVHRQRRRE